MSVTVGEGQTESQPSASGSSNSGTSNPFDGLFAQRGGLDAREESVVQTQFFRRMFMESPVDVGLFMDPGVPQVQAADEQEQEHIFLPFFGGPDDRLALAFVVQLCSKETTRATVVRFTKVDSELTPVDTIEVKKPLDHGHVTVSGYSPSYRMA